MSLFDRHKTAPGTRPRSMGRPCAAPVCNALLVLVALLVPAVGLCEIETQWGGHLRAIGTVSWPDDQSIYQFTNMDSPFYDGQAEWRLNNQLFIGSQWRLETHYEAVLLSGDTTEANTLLTRNLPGAGIDLITSNVGMDDDRRLLDLTHTIDDGDGHLLYHRLDRLNLTWAAEWGTLRLGRQALTWGNGLVFNPMDLFNPFAPTTVLRDYKAGEDMAYLQHTLGSGELQLLFVPRRNPENGDIEEEQASYAAKYHLARSPYEFDLMVARHYSDAVFGAGITGFLGGAAWRLDTLYTLLDPDKERDHFWQVVANIDYAWQWGGKNFYGLLEYYYSGLGYEDDFDRALSDADLVDRLERGELFALGRHYLAAQMQTDLHPLVQAGLAAIANLEDGSGFFQPQLLWDVDTNWQLILGGNLYWGNDDTEYGGYDTRVGLATITVVPSDSIFLWLTYYY